MKGILCNITHFAVPTPFKTYLAITAYTATVPATNAYTILMHQPFFDNDYQFKIYSIIKENHYQHFS